MKPTILIRLILLTAVSLLASRLPSNAINLLVPNGSFEDTTSPYFLNGQNGYSDQYPGYNNFPTVVMFNGWENQSRQGGLRYHELSTAGYTGADGAYAAQALDSSQYIESLNPVTQIVANATYTLTLSLNVPAAIGDSSFQLLATSQAPDTTTYHYSPTGNGYVDTISPNPVITTLGTLADSGAIHAGDTGATAFQDYSITFNTLNGANSQYVGDNLSIFIQLNANGTTGSSVDNVRLSVEAVPEPGTWALMFAGVAGLLVIGRRKLQA